MEQQHLLISFTNSSKSIEVYFFPKEKLSGLFLKSYPYINLVYSFKNRPDNFSLGKKYTSIDLDEFVNDISKCCCSICGKKTTLICETCEKVSYCSNKCKDMHWHVHKLTHAKKIY
jgi:hypothetical protein